MLRALQSCLIILSSIILLSTSAYAITRQEFLYQQENNIIKLCEDAELLLQKQRAVPFAHYLGLPAHYECGITGFYALRKVVELITTVDRGSDDYKVLGDLMEKNYIEEYETYDFIVIHLDFERYLEEKSDD